MTATSTTRTPTARSRAARRRRRRSLVARAALVAGAALVGVVGTARLDALAGPVVSGELSTGARSVFVPIESFRVYDSRADAQPEPWGGKLRPSSDVDANRRPVWIAYEAGGDGTRLIPFEASAVTYNVQVVQTEGSGHLAVDGFGFVDGSTSTIVWDGPGQRRSGSGVAMVTSAFDDAGALGLIVGGGPGAGAHVIVDVTGYYVDA